MRKENLFGTSFYKKAGVIALAAVLTCGTLSGCGSKEKKESSKKTESTKADTGKDAVLGVPDAASYIKKLAEYKTIPLKKSEIDEELQKKKDEQLSTYAKYEEVKTGKVAKGDMVNIYYVGKIDGKEFDGGSCTEETNPDGYNLTIGSGAFIPGFEDSLIGKKIGTTVDINVTFPKDYGSADVAGKDAVFTVTLNYRQGEKVSQKFDDDFVSKNLSSTYESLKDYETKVRKDIIKEKAIKKVVEETKLEEYPEELSEKIKKQFTTPIEQYISTQNMTMDDFISQNYSSKSEYEEDLKKNVEAQVKGQVVYNAIAQAEDLKVDESKLEDQIKNYITSYSVADEKALDEQFQKSYGGSARELIYGNLLYDTVAEYLTKNAVEK